VEILQPGAGDKGQGGIRTARGGEVPGTLFRRGGVKCARDGEFYYCSDEFIVDIPTRSVFGPGSLKVTEEAGKSGFDVSLSRSGKTRTCLAPRSLDLCVGVGFRPDFVRVLARGSNSTSEPTLNSFRDTSRTFGKRSWPAPMSPDLPRLAGGSPPAASSAWRR
jgi:hypothetical protein